MLLRNKDQNLFIEVDCHFIRENIIYSIIVKLRQCLLFIYSIIKTSFVISNNQFTS